MDAARGTEGASSPRTCPDMTEQAPFHHTFSPIYTRERVIFLAPFSLKHPMENRAAQVHRMAQPSFIPTSASTKEP
jgi:hypothetical protein